MANANVTKLGIDAAVALEEKAAVDVAPAQNDPVAPNVSERRVKGTVEVPAPNGSVIVIEHL